jgi:hypothetical protein
MPAIRVDASGWKRWSVSSVLLGGRTFRGRIQKNIYISKVGDEKKRK